MTVRNVPVRVDLGEGEWWDIQPLLTRRIKKAMRQTQMKIFRSIMPADAEITQDREEQMALLRNAMKSSEIVVDPVLENEDTMLVHATIAWSFPEPVSLEAIDDRDDRHVQLVLARMEELYGEADEAFLTTSTAEP